jgi:hypothetical protein
VFILYTVLFGALMLFYSSGEGWVGLVVNIAVYGYLFFYRLLKMSTKIEHIEFDDDFLYVIRRRSDVLIPLENIRSVEIKTIGGYIALIFI